MQKHEGTIVNRPGTWILCQTHASYLLMNKQPDFWFPKRGSAKCDAFWIAYEPTSVVLILLAVELSFCEALLKYTDGLMLARFQLPPRPCLKCCMPKLAGKFAIW